MNRFLPYMPRRWTYAAVALAAIAVFAQVLEVLVDPTGVNLIAEVLSWIVIGVFAFAVVFVIYFTVQAVRRR